MSIWRMGQTARLLLGGWFARITAPLSSKRRDRAAKVAVERVESRSLLATLTLGMGAARPGDVVEIAPGAYFSPVMADDRGEVAIRVLTADGGGPASGFGSNSRIDAGAAGSGGLETPFLREMAIEGLEIGDWGGQRGDPALSAGAGAVAPSAWSPNSLNSAIYVGINLSLADPSPLPSDDQAVVEPQVQEGESASDVSVLPDEPSEPVSDPEPEGALDDLADVTLLTDEASVLAVSAIKPPPLAATISAETAVTPAAAPKNSEAAKLSVKAKTSAHLKETKAKPATSGRTVRKPIRAAVALNSNGSRSQVRIARPRTPVIPRPQPQPQPKPQPPAPLVATPSAPQVRPAPASQRVTVTEVFLETEAKPAGEAFTFSAFVRENQAGIGSQGTVTFLADGQPIGSAPVVNGQARLTTTALTAGRRQIVARFEGSAELASSVSEPRTQLVYDAPPPPIAFGTRVFTPKLPTRTGESFLVYVRTPTTSSGSIDEGNVRLFINGRLHATAEVDNGLATFVVSGLPAGDYAIGARRVTADGQSSELAASVAHKVYNLAPGVKFPTLVWLFTDRTRNAAGLFTIKAIIGDTGATGIVQLWDGDRLLGAMNMDQEGVAVFQTGLAPGFHQLRAVYLGDPNFNGASSILYSANFS